MAEEVPDSDIQRVSDAEPQMPTICGNLYFCCADIRCEDGTTKDYDHFICPSRWGYSDTRAAAWSIWKSYLPAFLGNKGKTKWPLYALRGASCYDQPRPKPCGNYPN